MSNASRLPPPKKEVALALLEESSLFIHLDPRRPNVVVPKYFMTQPQLVLQVGLNMAIPIPDLHLDEDGITCTLSFNRSPFWCSIPWTSVYALIGEDGRGGVWPEDVPPEVQLQQRGASQQKPQQKRPRPRLAAVGSRPPSSPPADARRDEPEILEEEPKRPTPIRRGPQAVPPLREVTDEASAAEADEPSAPPPPAPQTGGKKKREIPPYLRVIK
jgi:stringent starvation protein B